MEIINKLDIFNDIITTNEGSTLFFIKPVVLENLPSIDPSLINDTYFKVETPETILSYFEDLLNDDDSMARIQVVNGLHLEDMCNAYYCDYCKTSIKDNCFFCCHCNKDMCKMCYEETSEEVALANDAKNYKRREESLNKCRTLNKIVPRNIYYIITPNDYRSCDLCNNSVTIRDNFYSIKTERYATYDICTNCYKTSDDARNIVETKSMQLIDVNDKSNYYFSYTGFGSMLYWFPIIVDAEDCRVLMNLNPEDKNYGKICLQSCDDYGRFGYFIADETYELHRILQRLKEICDKGTFEYEEGIGGEHTVTITHKLCSKHHSSPIQILMTELKMSVYYG